MNYTPPNKLKYFNIRVYAVIINDDNQVLLTDEFRLGIKMTKFPGGGLKFGEGTIDCLQREAIEEFGQDIKIIDHFYTTDFFQPTFHRNDQQLISIYYLAEFSEKIHFKISKRKFDFEKLYDGVQSFRWIKMTELTPEDVTFPVDKKVAALIRDKFLNE
jgi:8-oxo-dGTP diphosphatase